MNVRDIISSPVSEVTRLKGHQTIRFVTDGFSLLVSDASYIPVFLREYSYERKLDPDQYASEAERILAEHELLDFAGESVLILDNHGFTVIPDSFYSEEYARSMLEMECSLNESEIIYERTLQERRIHILFPCPGSLEVLKNRLTGKCSIIHSVECLMSLSDQVRARDHQRGFLLADVQDSTLALLVIRADEIILLNRYQLGDPSDFIYHTLNTMKQLDMDRETVPVYISGTVHPDHELSGLIKKYIRHVKSTPYYLENLSREEMLRYMLLSEGSKCA